jgi:2-dehydropantoate 2-reductase
MKICIIGAGAIGGFIGTRLALTGEAQVSALARGATLSALQAHGWRLQTAEGLLQATAHASDDAKALGTQDLVVIAVKGPALAAVAQGIAPLLHSQTIVLPAMNGVPWWFCQGLDGMDEGPLKSVDPGGSIGSAIPLHHVVGCVVHASTATSEPGLVHHRIGQGLIIGEAQGGQSERVERLGRLLSVARFDVTCSSDIRHDIWYKLWGNMTMNPVSALTGATTDRILEDPLVRAFCSAAMREASAIGERLGCPIAQDVEERHAITARLGHFKTSMLQDAEAGRMLEIDAIVGAVQELGERAGVPTPNIDALLGLTRLFAQTRALYPAA